MKRRLLFVWVVGSVIAVSVASGQGTDTLRLTLGEAVAKAVAMSDEVGLALSQISVLEAQFVQARAATLPGVTLRGGYTQVTKNARAAIVSSLFGQSYTYTASVNISQPLFQGGRLLASVRGASDLLDASRATLAETKARLSVQAQRLYLSAVLARQLEEIQVRNAELADHRVAQVEQLEKAGRASRYDLLKARVTRANLEPGLLQARSDREIAEIELRQFLNIPSDLPLLLVSEIDTTVLRSVVRQIVADSGSARRPRPLLRAAELTLEARREALRVARADFFPTISVFFNTGYTALPSTSRFPTVWGRTSAEACPPGTPEGRVCQNNGWYPDRSYGLQLSWSVFDGLRAKGALDLARANERIARLQLEQVREQVVAEVARALSEFGRAEATFEARRQNVDEAEEAYRIAWLRFERGLGTQLEVTDAQLALFTARVNAARAVVDYYLAAAELARARGQNVPLPPVRPVSR